MTTHSKFPNSAFVEEAAAKLGAFLKHAPTKDIEQNMRASLTAMLGKLDLVTSEEFDVQTEVLARTRARLAALEARVADLEKQRLP